MSEAFIEFVEIMGGDLAVVGKTSGEMTERDERVVQRLLHDQNSAVFGQSVMTWYIRCPVFVAREWSIHQIGVFNETPERFKMASMTVVKHSNLFVDSLEGSYVWDENLVSVANKKLRQPKNDEWVEGPMRCLENIVSNFCALQITDEEKARREAEQRQQRAQRPASHPQAWMS